MIDGAGNDADIGAAVRNQADNLVAQPLFQVDADIRIGRKERTKCLRQKFGQRVGIGTAPAPARPGRGHEGVRSSCRRSLCARIDRACCSKVRPAWVGVTPWRPRTSSSAPKVFSILRMRVEAAASARFARAAPWVMLPASTIWRKRLGPGEIEAHGSRLPFLFEKANYAKHILHRQKDRFKLRH